MADQDDFGYGNKEATTNRRRRRRQRAKSDSLKNSEFEGSEFNYDSIHSSSFSNPVTPHFKTPSYAFCDEKEDCKDEKTPELKDLNEAKSPSFNSVGNGNSNAYLLHQFDDSIYFKFHPSFFGLLSQEVFGSDHLRDDAESQDSSKRERVYNTMFHVPWRCELLINMGILLCLDSFLSIFTILPIRIMRIVWKHAFSFRKRKFHPDEISDLAKSFILILCVSFLLHADVSLIYHWIRGQAAIKLYVIFNVLEVFDKLCQSFGSDILQVVYNLSDSLSKSKKSNHALTFLQLVVDEGIACVCFIVHALIIMTQAITLNVAFNSHNNAILTLLISANFTEVKGSVFKRFSKENLQKLVYQDVVERFHMICHLIFVLIQNIVRGEDAGIITFFKSASMVYCCEVIVDLVKHAFSAKFNDHKPEIYSGFLHFLCLKTISNRSQHVHRTMNFVPLSSACVVIRALYPLLRVTSSKLPFPSQSISFLSLLFLFFVIGLGVKAVVGFFLQMYARWYLSRRLRRNLDSSFNEVN